MKKILIIACLISLCACKKHQDEIPPLIPVSATIDVSILAELYVPSTHGELPVDSVQFKFYTTKNHNNSLYDTVPYKTIYTDKNGAGNVTLKTNEQYCLVIVTRTYKSNTLAGPYYYQSYLQYFTAKSGETKTNYPGQQDITIKITSDPAFNKITYLGGGYTSGYGCTNYETQDPAVN